MRRPIGPFLHLNLIFIENNDLAGLIKELLINPSDSPEENFFLGNIFLLF
jgi:hypothetical protein